MTVEHLFRNVGVAGEKRGALFYGYKIEKNRSFLCVKARASEASFTLVRWGSLLSHTEEILVVRNIDQLRLRVV